MSNVLGTTKVGGSDEGLAPQTAMTTTAAARARPKDIFMSVISSSTPNTVNHSRVCDDVCWLLGWGERGGKKVARTAAAVAGAQMTDSKLMLSLSDCSIGDDDDHDD